MGWWCGGGVTIVDHIVNDSRKERTAVERWRSGGGGGAGVGGGEEGMDERE